MYAPPLRYKREALAAHSRQTLWTLSQHKLGFTPNNPVLNLLRAQAIQHSGHRVLRTGGPNHSKPVVFIVFLHLDWANPSYPEYSTSGFRRVHYATRL